MKLKIFLFTLLTLCLMNEKALWGAPVITQITPSFGPTSGGNTVDIVGSGLTGATSVTFDSQSVVPTVISDSQLNVIAPSHVTGMVNVSVTTASGTSLPTSASAYVYQGDWVAYVTDINSASITPIDLPTNTPETPLTLPQNFFSGGQPFGIAITPDGKTAYVTVQINTLTGSFGFVVPLDLVTNQFGNPINEGSTPFEIAITPDGQTAYVVNFFANTVVPIDLMTGQPGMLIPVGNGPKAIAIRADGMFAYVTNFTDNTVTPINIANNSNQPGTPIPVGRGPQGIAITPDSQTAYVVNTFDGTVVPIDLSSNTLDPIIFVGNGLSSIAITPDGQTAYVTGTDSVFPIDLATNQVGPGIFVGDFPVNLTITPDGQTLYVTNPFNNTVIPIDIATNQPGTPIPVGNDPVSIVVTPDQAPVASFAVAAASVGGITSFDARASRSPVGTIASYAWDFGDGSAAVITSSPMITHIYQAPGNYSATLTVTNSAGTSTTKVLTRGTVNRNGGPSAILSQMVSISMPTPLPLAPSDFDIKVIKNVFATQTEYIHHLTWKPSLDRSVVKYKLFRNGHLIKKISSDGPFVFNDHNRKKHQKDRYTLVAINAQGVKSSHLTIVVR